MRTVFNRTVLMVVVLSACVFGLSSCAPRGETKTLDEVLLESKARYAQSKPGDLNSEVNASLDSIVANIEKIASHSKDARSSGADEISKTLAILIPKAGFTSRPALTQIERQYRLLASSAQEEMLAKSNRKLRPEIEGAVPPHVKLLQARTYRVLARELETTRFRL